MTKRKRLTVPLIAPGAALGEGANPPIAKVVAQESAHAALTEIADELADARSSGRLAITLPLERIDENHLIRDRIGINEDEMAALMNSLRARGQQVPVEVAELSDGCYGLISGWRRLLALRRLAAEHDGQRFGNVLCLVRRPETAAEAYVSMVEENEIRSGLSYYERARVALRAAEQGVFPTPRLAVRHLFASASRAKQSKIGSFLIICEKLDHVLRFPAALPERLGLALARRLADDPALESRIREALSAEAVKSAAIEQRLLAKLIGGRASAGDSVKPVPEKGNKGAQIELRREGDSLVLRGPGVTSSFRRKLAAWLVKQS